MQDGLAAPGRSIPCRTLRLRPLRRHASPCVHYLQTTSTARVPSVLPPRGNPLGDNEHCHARGRASPVPWQRERAWQTSSRAPRLAAEHAPSQTRVQTYGRRGRTFELVVYAAEGIGRFAGPCATRAHGLVHPDDVPDLGDVGEGGHEEDPAVAADAHRRERRLRLRARLDGKQGSVTYGGEAARTTRRRITPLGDGPFARSLEKNQRPDAGESASSDHVTSGSTAAATLIARLNRSARVRLAGIERRKNPRIPTQVVLRPSSRSHRGACSP